MEYKARIANANEGMSAEAHIKRRDEFNGKSYDFNQLPIQKYVLTDVRKR